MPVPARSAVGATRRPALWVCRVEGVAQAPRSPKSGRLTPLGSIRLSDAQEVARPVQNDDQGRSRCEHPAGARGRCNGTADPSAHDQAHRSQARAGYDKGHDQDAQDGITRQNLALSSLLGCLFDHHDHPSSMTLAWMPLGCGRLRWQCEERRSAGMRRVAGSRKPVFIGRHPFQGEFHRLACPSTGSSLCRCRDVR